MPEIAVCYMAFTDWRDPSYAPRWSNVPNYSEDTTPEGAFYSNISNGGGDFVGITATREGTTREQLRTVLDRLRSSAPDVTASAWSPEALAEIGARYIGVYVVHLDRDSRSNIERDGENPRIFTDPSAALRYARETVRVRRPEVRDPYLRVSWWRDADSLPSEYWPPAPFEIPGIPLNTGNTSTVKGDEPSYPTACGNCGRFGHNRRTCVQTQPQAIDRIGIEIEGRWFNLRQMKTLAREDGLDGATDGSVMSGRNGAEAYEFKTKPENLANALRQLAKFYPDEADHSCGLHVHVSFKAPTDISLLNTAKFYEYFEARWTAFGTRERIHPRSDFWRRLRGGNNYCKRNTSTSGFLEMDRYHQLNFSSWQGHRTLECRLLPMFRTRELALRAVQELIDIYETYLQGATLELEQSEFSLPIPSLATSIEVLEVDATFSTPETIAEILEVVDLPPPAPGMSRVALPGGEINAAMLRQWAV